LHSVVEQTYENIELIVIDDCSPDKTAEVARKELAKPEYQQKLRNIVLHEKKINQGAHNAINDGIKEAKGDWINILNSDDRFICNRIKSLILTAQSTGSRFLFSKIRCIGGNQNFFC
jgi:glycosyltransferase involved in cell wall biosynthesis